MWIKTQWSTLVDVDEFQIKKSNECERFDIITNKGNVGSYENKMRAEEIMNEVEKKIRINPFNPDNGYYIENNNFYEMPLK